MNKRDKDFNTKMMKGLIPWSVDECLEVIKEIGQLLNTPMDDWNHSKKGLSLLDDKTGKVMRLEFNTFHPLYQITSCVFNKYDNDKEFIAHSMRLFQIIRFIQSDKTRLIRDNLLRIDKNGMVNVRDALIKSLCILPYSKDVKTKHGKEHHFLYSEVLQKVKTLMMEK